MNASVPGSQLRQPGPQDSAGFTPVPIVRSVARRADALPAIAAIAALFVLLALLIILAVRCGPRLRTLRVALHHEPLPRHTDSALLTRWTALGSLGSLPAPASAGLACHCSCSHRLHHAAAEPRVIEITYL